MPLSVPCVEDESISNIRFAKQTCSKTIWYLFRGGFGGGFTHKPTAKQYYQRRPNLKKVGTQIIAQSVGEEEQEGEIEGRGGEKEKNNSLP